MSGASPEPVLPGSRWESVLLFGYLVLDLASTPFHLVLFLLVRGRIRRRFARAMAETVA